MDLSVIGFSEAGAAACRDVEIDEDWDDEHDPRAKGRGAEPVTHGEGEDRAYGYGAEYEETGGEDRRDGFERP